LQGGVLPCTYNPTCPHDHHATPASQTPPLTAPWHPALSAISPALAPSHHAASTDHRLPPPRIIITTAGKCFHPSARALSLLGSRSHAASQQLRTSACAPRHCCTNTVVCRARRTRERHSPPLKSSGAGAEAGGGHARSMSGLIRKAVAKATGESAKTPAENVEEVRLALASLADRSRPPDKVRPARHPRVTPGRRTGKSTRRREGRRGDLRA
jgi:hypothetical protein